MTNFIELLTNHMFAGGMGGVVAVLIAFIIFLLYDRNRLLNDSDEKDDKIEAIIDEYYKGTITISDAFNSLKSVLMEIKTKL